MSYTENLTPSQLEQLDEIRRIYFKPLGFDLIQEFREQKEYRRKYPHRRPCLLNIPMEFEDWDAHGVLCELMEKYVIEPLEAEEYEVDPYNTVFRYYVALRYNPKAYEPLLAHYKRTKLLVKKGRIELIAYLYRLMSVNRIDVRNKSGNQNNHLKYLCDQYNENVDEDDPEARIVYDNGSKEFYYIPNNIIEFLVNNSSISLNIFCGFLIRFLNQNKPDKTDKKYVSFDITAFNDKCADLKDFHPSARNDFMYKVTTHIIHMYGKTHGSNNKDNRVHL